MIDVNEIREIVIDHYDAIAGEREVNELLAQGWILINVTQRGYAGDGEAFYSTVYTFGRKA